MAVNFCRTGNFVGQKRAGMQIDRMSFVGNHRLHFEKIAAENGSQVHSNSQQQKRSVMALLKFQTAPFHSMVNQLARTAMNELSTLTETGLANPTSPAVNILESADGFELQLTAPGFEKSAFKIQVENGLLTISAEKSASSEPVADEKWHRREFRTASFSRSFRLPESVDSEKMEARFEQGILTVSLVKKEEAKPVIKTVEVA